MRKLNGHVGTLTPQITQPPEGQFATAFVARYLRAARTLVLPVMETILNGVSIR